MDKYSLDPLPPNIKQGLIAISTLAMISIVTTGGAIMFIVMRLFDKHNYQSAPLRFNQSIILILNLLLADFQQALSFVLSIHWVTKNAILAPTTACNVQAWMVQMGDVSSGLFSLAIAMQTFYIIVMQRNLPYKVFVSCVVGIWVVCITMSIISPIAHRNKHLYVSTGAWCWIADNYREEVNTSCSPITNQDSAS